MRRNSPGCGADLDDSVSMTTLCKGHDNGETTMVFRSERFLAVYSGVLTLVFVGTVLAGANGLRSAAFEEIDVQRINVREPDGTIKLVISNETRFPDEISMGGKSVPHKRENAGLLFFNDDGIESGGLIFAGHRGPDGSTGGFVHLSMDQYMQDQVLALNHIEDGDIRTAGLTVRDRRDMPLLEQIAEMEALGGSENPADRALLKQRMKSGYYGAKRVYVGKNGERESIVDLRDASGRTRLRMVVGPGGKAAIEFLDADGNVVRALTSGR